MKIEPVIKRPSWHQYYLDIAEETSKRSTCNRKQVGAVVVSGRSIVATGYNGSISGFPHCTDTGCFMDNGHCINTIHAEQNCLVAAARAGCAIKDAVIYITCSPCWNCFKLISNAGIKKIIYKEFYNDQKIFEAARFLNISLERYDFDKDELVDGIREYIKKRTDDVVEGIPYSKTYTAGAFRNLAYELPQLSIHEIFERLAVKDIKWVPKYYFKYDEIAGRHVSVDQELIAEKLYQKYLYAIIKPVGVVSSEDGLPTHRKKSK